MKKEPLIVFISILFLLVSCRVKDENIESAIFAPVNYVDPYIGTGGHGHTFLGVAAPFGAVQIGPNNINKGLSWVPGCVRIFPVYGINNKSPVSLQPVPLRCKCENPITIESE